LPEIKTREDAFANRFAVFKHRLAHAAGKIRTILRLAREPVRVDDERHFFTKGCYWQELLGEKLFTFSHNFHKTVTRPTRNLGLEEAKARLSPAQNRKLRIKNTAGTHSSPSSPARVPSVLFSCAGWEKAGGEVARQQLKIDRGKLAPHEPVSQYQHNRTGEDNADAHLKRQIMGREVVVAITKGKLDLGPWEQIFYGEFAGRRRKRVLVKIIGE
jgi:hypothetical protein